MERGSVEELERYRLTRFISSSLQPFNEKMKHRMLRINEVVKRELSGIIAREMSFEAALVSINHVDVTSDLKNAHVFVSVLGTEAGESVMSKLTSHRAALQAELARHVTMKYTPHLIFHLDNSIERGARVIEIMQEMETSQGEKK
jgi:ribosome-binding factor A